jgi:hypothetical protein
MTEVMIIENLSIEENDTIGSEATEEPIMWYGERDNYFLHEIQVDIYSNRMEWRMRRWGNKWSRPTQISLPEEHGEKFRDDILRASSLDRVRLKKDDEDIVSKVKNFLKYAHSLGKNPHPRYGYKFTIDHEGKYETLIFDRYPSGKFREFKHQLMELIPEMYDF